ncbi:MAG TPA: carbon storage regulator [Candidatus Binatia bacterium]|nr:carbon storage regulator [Candidatus Binatia bacterium]
MLVLRRKAGEAIVLNGVITIHVLAVEGERVKLGISAPPEVVIVRSELLENQGGPMGSSMGPGASSPMNPSPRSPYRDPNAGGPGGEDGHSQRRDYNSPGSSSGYGMRGEPRAANEAPYPVRSNSYRYR